MIKKVPNGNAYSSKIWSYTNILINIEFQIWWWIYFFMLNILHWVFKQKRRCVQKIKNVKNIEYEKFILYLWKIIILKCFFTKKHVYKEFYSHFNFNPIIFIFKNPFKIYLYFYWTEYCLCFQYVHFIDVTSLRHLTPNKLNGN